MEAQCSITRSLLFAFIRVKYSAKSDRSEAMVVNRRFFSEPTLLKGELHMVLLQASPDLKKCVDTPRVIQRNIMKDYVVMLLEKVWK